MLKRTNYLAIVLMVIAFSCGERNDKHTTTKGTSEVATHEKGKENLHSREVIMDNINQLIAVNGLNPELKVSHQQEWAVIEEQSLDIIELNDLSCGLSFLFIKKDSVISNIIQIREDCDSDQSYYKHEWTEYKLVSDTLFLIKLVEQVLDKSLVDNNGFIKDGTERSKTPSYKVDTNYFYGTTGDFIKIKENKFKLIRGEYILKKCNRRIDFE